MTGRALRSPRACRGQRGGVGFLPLAVLVLIPGCFATSKQVDEVQQGMAHRGAWTDERIEQLDQRIEETHSENEALRVRMDDLSDQIAALGGEVSQRLNELAAKDDKVTDQLLQASLTTTSLKRQDEEGREAMLAKLNLVLQEVLDHNERLEKRIEELETSMVLTGRMHTVKKGESVASIAAKYKVTAQQIIEANGLSDANLIQVGQDLFIPGSSP